MKYRYLFTLALATIVMGHSGLRAYCAKNQITKSPLVFYFEGKSNAEAFKLLPNGKIFQIYDPKQTVSHVFACNGLVFSPDGRFAFVGVNENLGNRPGADTIYTYSVRNGLFYKVKIPPARLSLASDTMAVEPAGRYIYVNEMRGKVEVFVIDRNGKLAKVANTQDCSPFVSRARDSGQSEDQEANMTFADNGRYLFFKNVIGESMDVGDSVGSLYEIGTGHKLVSLYLANGGYVQPEPFRYDETKRLMFIYEPEVNTQHVSLQVYRCPRRWRDDARLKREYDIPGNNFAWCEARQLGVYVGLKGNLKLVKIGKDGRLIFQPTNILSFVGAQFDPSGRYLIVNDGSPSALENYSVYAIGSGDSLKHIADFKPSFDGDVFFQAPDFVSEEDAADCPSRMPYPLGTYFIH